MATTVEGQPVRKSRTISRRTLLRSAAIGAAGLAGAVLLPDILGGSKEGSQPQQGPVSSRNGQVDTQGRSEATTSQSRSNAENTKSNTSPNIVVDSGAEYGVLSNEAPDFEFESINGQTVRLSDYRGRTVLLSFWQTGYVKGGPEVISGELEPQLPADIAHISFVIGETKEGMDELVKSVEEKYGKIDYPIIPFSLQDNEVDLMNEFGIIGWPQYFVIDPEGKITKTFLGAGKTSEIIDFLNNSN